MHFGEPADSAKTLTDAAEMISKDVNTAAIGRDFFTRYLVDLVDNKTLRLKRSTTSFEELAILNLSENLLFSELLLIFLPAEKGQTFCSCANGKVL